MEIKRRYFRLEGALLDIAKLWKDTVWSEHCAELKRFFDEFGTNEFMRRGRDYIAVLDVGIDIPGSRPSKKFPGFLEPNARTEAGKYFQSRLQALKVPTCDPLWKVIASDAPWFVREYIVSPGMTTFGEIFAVSVPAEISYTPHEEMIEIKEWEFLKLKDEYENE